MTKGRSSRSHADDLRGAGKLAVFATKAITDVVEGMHRAIFPPVSLVSGLLFGPVRLGADWVGSGLDHALERLASVLGRSVPGPEREAILAMLNGVVGDYLADTENPLAIPMAFRRGGVPLDLSGTSVRRQIPNAASSLILLVHGSSMNDLQWTRGGHNHGAELAAETGHPLLSLHYNSGLHISTNGRAFAELLDALDQAWPSPLREIHVLAHSMGGLVTRSAVHVADTLSMAWRPKLRRFVTIGTPHNGSPIERWGVGVHALLGAIPYSAPIARLARLRSAGITDLRFGNLLESDWQGRDRFSLHHDARTHVPLPAGVDCYAVAGTTTKTPTARLAGDGLVPVASALGRHRLAERRLTFSAELVATSTSHLDLLSSPRVYAELRRWFGLEPTD